MWLFNAGPHVITSQRAVFLSYGFVIYADLQNQKWKAKILAPKEILPLSLN
jgi:hypothetical protein